MNKSLGFLKLHLEKLSPTDRQMIEGMIRVNQAGELGAVRIYQGQKFILGNTSSRTLLSHMLEQEKVHLNTFNNIIAENHIRPTVLRPLWNVAGIALGVGTALLGKEAAMMCTEAVENVIGEHYNDQIRDLLLKQEYSELREIIKQFRDEELEHLDIAVKNESEKVIYL
jgi:ubiquinone biosynthesis monooxygenase Coq7